MNKITGAVIVSVFAMAAQAMATVTLNIGAGYLRDHGGSLVATNTRVIVVAETGGGLGQDGLTNLTFDTSLTVGTSIGSGGNYQILSSTPLTVDGESYFNGAVNNLALSGGLATGNNVYILWFEGLTPSSTTVGSGTYYGVFGGGIATPYSLSEFGDAWQLPSDGFTVYMWGDDSVAGGSVPNGLLTANYQATLIPEPSTWMLVGSGLVGALFLRRRNK